jgi:hypothetical protein
MVPVAEGAPAARTNNTRVATNKITRMFLAIENASVFMIAPFMNLVDL